jgi:hypothetical protein
MWPEPGEALSRTIAAESAVSDLFAEALRRWTPTARAVALPALTAAAELPPDPAALAQAQDAWDQHAEDVVLAGMAVLWATAVYEAARELGAVPADIAATALSGVDTVALAIVLASVLMPRRDVQAAVAYVDATPELAAAREEFLAVRRERVSATPARVAAKVEAALAAKTREVETSTPAPELPDGVSITIEVVPETRPEVLRAETEAVLDAASAELRELARHEGYEAAGMLNHAVLAAARQASAAEDQPLEKTWICTLDGKTRPSHWAGDGQRVPLDAPFGIGVAQLMFPGDPAGPPEEVKNCRCRMGILAPDEPLPDEVDRHTERLDGRDSVAINREGRTQQEEIERRRAAGNVRARDTEDGVGRIASASWTTEQEIDMKPSDLAAKTTTLAADDSEQGAAETFVTFQGYIGKLGVPTSDQRILAADIELSMREFPHPVAWQKQASGGHHDSFTVGVCEEARIDGDRVWARGYFLNSDEAREAMEQVAHKVSAPSLDLAASEYIFTDEDGNQIDGDLFDWVEENGDPYVYFTSAEVTGFTLVQTPAFDGIDIELGERETRDVGMVAAVIAAADGPRLQAYDPALFEDPKLTRPTAPTMDNTTGRIYGHLAEWGHRIRGGSELTPRNRNGYANFHTSQVLLTNGKQLSVGRLTVQGGHAPTDPGTTMATARAHYDNVCTAFALVRVGEDEHGIWFSGVPAPGVDPEVFQAGMTAPLSGDWRDCGQGLDMIAAHAVNAPGFPIYSAVTGPDGRELSLVASLGPSRSKKTGGEAFTMDRDSLKTLLAEVVETVDRRRADEFAARRRSEAVLARAREALAEEQQARVAALLERA